MRLMGNKELMANTEEIMVHSHYKQSAIKQLNEGKANANKLSSQFTDKERRC